MECNPQQNPDCVLRHQRQDDTDNKIEEIYNIICGGLHPEESLSTKVNEMYKENQSVKKFIQGCLVSLIVLIFWCGYQFAVLQNCVVKIEKLEAQYTQLQK